MNRIIVLFILLFFVSLNSFAQLYTRTTFTAPYIPISAGTGATVSTATGNDVNQTGIALGFTFNYAGINYTTIGLNTNGLLWFDSIAPSAGEGAYNTNMFVSGAGGTDKSISAWWTDMTDDASSDILYQTQGTAGSQTFKVQYTNYPHYTGVTGTNVRLNFQVVFYEGTNVLEFRYGSTTGAGPATGSGGACIAIEYGAGGEGNFLDLVTGSGSTTHGMLSPLVAWPAYNYRLTPGAPTPVAAGTYNVGIGQTYPSLTLATSDLNHRGISGPVTLNLTDNNYDTTVANGSHIFPVFVGPVAGTSAVNTITISKSGAPATLSYRGSPVVVGGFGSGYGLSSINDSEEPILGVCASYTTISNINLVSLGTTTNDVEVGLMVFEANGGTNGAKYNLFDRISVNMDRTNNNTVGIFSNNISGPGGFAGTNSYNTYRDITIRDSYVGINLAGVGTATGPPDEGNQIITSSCTSFNSIGNPAVPNDIGGGSSLSYGIRLAGQENFIVKNNIIRNVSTTGPSALVEGISIDYFFGNGEVSNNIVRTISRNHATGTGAVTGIKLTSSGNQVKTLNVFNNSISEILSSYSGAATATRILKGMVVEGSGNSGKQSMHIWNNSVSINGTGSLSASNTCFEISAANAVEHIVKNNVFANFTPAQTGFAKHYCWVTPLADRIGFSVNTSSDFNDLYIANDQGTSGHVGLGLSTNYSTLALWQAGITFNAGTDANSVSSNPFFANNTTNLHGTVASIAINGAGTTPPIYVTSDIDCDARSAPHDIGSDDFTPGCPADGGILTPTTATVCAATSYTMTTAGFSIGPGTSYQWMISGTSGGPYSNVTGGTGATTTSYTKGSLVAGTYYYVLKTTCGNGGTDLSNELTLVVKALPSPTITSGGPTTFCNGGSVLLNAPTGANRSYQWKKSGANIAGATSSSYTATTSGNYKVVVTNTSSGCSKTTGTATVVTVNPLPTATVTPQGPTSFCAGGSVVLQANTGVSLTYKWKRNGNYLTGATQSAYTATLAGTYKAEVTNSNGCSKLSSGTAVTVPCKDGEDLLTAAEISVFPNPAQDMITVSFDFNEPNEIEIVNLPGERILRVQNQNQIDISKLAPGIYFIKVWSQSGLGSQKFIKQ